jgi:hypothetical protein
MKTVRLTENDLMKIVKRVMSEQETAVEDGNPGSLDKGIYYLYNKEKLEFNRVNAPIGVEFGVYEIFGKDGSGKPVTLIFDCKKPDTFKIKGKPFSSLENKELSGELMFKKCRRQKR